MVIGLFFQLVQEILLKKQTWKEKIFSPNTKLPKIEKIRQNQQKLWGKGTIVIPHPRDVLKIMNNVKKGKLITINIIRQKLAKKYKTTTCCPICAGIFSSIVAHYADELERKGIKKIPPYWRTLKEGGVLNEKFPGDTKNQEIRLKQEGFTIDKKGKKYFVVDYEKDLVKV